MGSRNQDHVKPESQLTDASCRSDILCEVSKTGGLLERGVDPITRKKEVRNQFSQTLGGLKLKEAAEADKANQFKGLVLPAGLPVNIQKDATSSSQVLRLAVGLLGMEVHKQPSSLSEAWLSYSDRSFGGLGGVADDSCSQIGATQRKTAEDAVEDDEEVHQWQLRVLQNVRQHVGRRQRAGAIGDAGSTQTSLLGATPGLPSRSSIKDGGGRASVGGSPGPDVQRLDWAHNFDEHLDLAETSLRKISHAVAVLQSPNKDDRPRVLRAFTDEQVCEVAADLRQWLEQLSTLVSLQHVNLLDLEEERSRLERLLQTKEGTFSQGESERKKAIIGRDKIKEQWEEAKLKSRLEAELGIAVAEDDPKIHSQKDVDAILEVYHKDHCEPLNVEVKALEQKRMELQERVVEKDKILRDLRAKLAHEDISDAPDSPRLPKAVEQALVASLNGIAERISEDTMSQTLVRISSEILAGNVDDWQEILAEVHRFEPEQRSVSKPKEDSNIATVEDDSCCTFDGPQHPASKGLSLMGQELESLSSELRECPISSGADKLSFLAIWVRDTINLVQIGVNSKEKLAQPLLFPPAPKWDLGVLKKMPGGKTTVAVNTEPMATGSVEELERMQKLLEKEWEERMQNLQSELEGQLRLAQEAAQKANAKAADALSRLAEESAIADNALNELRRKMISMQTMLAKAGFGAEAAEAVQAAGLTDFLEREHNVFERLYRDALDRMRRLAEMQAKIFEKQSDQFLRSINDYMRPGFNLPGLQPFDGSILEQGPDQARAPFLQDAALMIQSGYGEGKIRKPSVELLDNRKPKQPVSERSPAKPDVSVKIDLLEPFSVLHLLDNGSGYMSTSSPRHGRKGADEASSKHRKISPPPEHRARSPRQDPAALDLGALSIGSMLPRGPAAPDGHSGYPGRAAPSSMQHSVAGPAIAGRPAVRLGKVAGGLADGESLPRLECRGQGKVSGSDAESPPPKQMQRAQSMSALSMASPTPLAPKVHSQLNSTEGLLTIGSLNIPVVGMGSPAPPQPVVGSPAKPQGKLQRPPGLVAVRSAPHLAPGPAPMPRLLMQSVY